MTAPVPAAGIVEAFVKAAAKAIRDVVVRDDVEFDSATTWQDYAPDARAALAVVLPKVADQIEALRIEPLGSEYLAGGNHALRDAAKLIRSLAEGLGDE